MKIPSDYPDPNSLPDAVTGTWFEVPQQADPETISPRYTRLNVERFEGEVELFVVQFRKGNSGETPEPIITAL